MPCSKTPRWPVALAALSALLVTACPQTTHPPDGGPTAGPTVGPVATATSPSTATGPSTGTATSTGTSTAPAGSIVGTWQSPSCGDRTYGRRIELGADGKFVAADLVSPCPKNVVCVWSGIVLRRGTYTLTGQKLTLTVTDGDAPQGKPLPASLGVDTGTGVPFETDSTGKACLYSAHQGGALD